MLEDQKHFINMNEVYMENEKKPIKLRYTPPELTIYGKLQSVARSSPLTENTTNVADCTLANCFPDPPPPIKG
ncbi:MAG: hypothetical protein CVV64_09665 [Candidatus Wallbacteria bacterium HGW-Wallbacteria-1]|uniref:Uncharacterized protein n=1 Tax=Candidatus Wallbacteria bacterium HGW-Wallbacteria-1 TaxID=2013854 RepID=A0A2N1PQK9_9BACT|nr:MAG: hypothetical protein CVV64_09665 [Candidatus Wallbacteria bacterium HGW-Wallbacteria-1]